MKTCCVGLAVLFLGPFVSGAGAAAEGARSDLSQDFRRDRGNGVTTSLLGSFVRPGQRMAYLFYECERDTTAAYTGEDLGLAGDEEYVGKSLEYQGVLFLAWGLTENVALEFETILHQRATLTRDPDDTTTGMPDRLVESRYGAIEAQLHWRLAQETAHRPEFFANCEVGPPDAGDMVLLGNQGWEVEAGVGAIKGFSWGAMAVRASVAYDTDSGDIDVGEFAVEYSRRWTEHLRFAAAVFGEPAELSVLGELQWRFRRNAFMRINAAAGVTHEAPDFGAQAGVVFAF
jgi:hypothetical protein